ncbi:flagellar assembly protein FliH [Massilia sp. CF038]|uniref:flagellar assembly protein FliH n=1 Tax=Massilia sp. CF038 TaxID=1881045 RepID=UPI0009340191|nr:flagellar assembly protein FliH [Massilia sp. CF038]
MNSFGDERPSAVVQRPPEPVLPSEDELNAIRDEARLIGYDEGHAAGYADGLAIGRTEAAKELEHLQTIAVTFGNALSGADENIANEVLELALQLAKGMLRAALEVKPELIIPLVREAVGYLPVLQQPAILLLNPADATIVRESIGEELSKGGWRVSEDAQIERGGCRIETASNQIDAQASSRWQRLAAALGKNNVEWLA